MNLILLETPELREDGTARLTDRRARHAAEVLRAVPGDRLQVGLVGGRMGTAEVLAASEREVVLRPALDRDPPPRAPVDLVVALPRPKILRKVLQAAASLGVRRLVLLGSWRVEKSYWASPLLAPAAIEGELRLGLEQGRDTIAPEVLVRRFFKPFVEDELDALFAEEARLLAHPAAATPLAARAAGAPRAAAAIGPEGGFTPYEAAALEARGFEPFSLGPRVLRVDVAVPCVTGQVALWLGLPRGGASGERPPSPG
ncbi:MAG TPA: 16S rRNA (uracil(1498)-N(3))-methyltransferase [Anaeromyxobacteraceae bacterium]|nr:16S rRNA (uracil(1498)-N(3))-methyltransferase [Anaeromyxobacteraceae bacterium]